MTKNTNLLIIGKVTFLLLLAFLITSITYNKHRILNSKIQRKCEIDLNGISVQYKKSLKDSVVNFGMKYLGTPYKVAGCGKDGFDCSGFVYFVFQHFKIKVPRSSKDFDNFGKEIPIQKVQKGDILLFLSPTRNAIGHIGIVSNPKGMESDFIHSSSGREMKVIITSLTNKGYTRRFVKAIRVLNQ